MCQIMHMLKQKSNKQKESNILERYLIYIIDNNIMISPTIEKYLNEACIPIRLSTTLPNGYPLVVSLWYLYEDQKFYCAVSREAKSIL